MGPELKLMRKKVDFSPIQRRTFKQSKVLQSRTSPLLHQSVSRHAKCLVPRTRNHIVSTVHRELTHKVKAGKGGDFARHLNSTTDWITMIITKTSDAIISFKPYNGEMTLLVSLEKASGKM